MRAKSKKRLRKEKTREMAGEQPESTKDVRE